MPPSREEHYDTAKRGHFYFGERGHYHFGMTVEIEPGKWNHPWGKESKKKRGRGNK
jgi:hypothetical protein